ncbi:AVAST type 2 anti-phage system protein Avs2 [Marinoscillum sp.]|uniref:AVAST type 2 anti-phage system protein Avs2 n=1 Tax=Marinoscillum sp. TaxID=2024838 RepID=UPI003BA90AD5
MTAANDQLLSTLTVRIKSISSKLPIGTGIIYHGSELYNKIYVLTAAHNLFENSESFTSPRKLVLVDFLDPNSNKYISLEKEIDYSLVSTSADEDIAILVFEKEMVEIVTGTLPKIRAIRDRLDLNEFTLKGFPNATQGKELACINPTWLQQMTESNRFQVELKDDYLEWSVKGFSGSGVFLKSDHEVYLFGIFTRYREEEKGKVIYCQYLDTVNEIIKRNYLEELSFSYLGKHQLTPSFFSKHLKTAIANLGPRFDSKLNFRLPIALLFNDLTKDRIFKSRLTHLFDEWLTARFYSSSKHYETIREIELGYESLKKDLIEWLPTIDWSPDKTIDISDYKDRINALSKAAREKSYELYDQRREIEKTNRPSKQDYSYNPPFEKEIHKLNQIQRFNHTFISNLNEINISLSNHPCLIVQGEAGSGKSHLFGDIAHERGRNEQPTILLLGQLFHNGRSVWQNIFDQLGLSCTKEEFLSSLNSIGEQIGSRALILIDALNEGDGKRLWFNELSGFVKEVSEFSYIGLAVSVRSTYYSSIIPSQLDADETIAKIEHQGFKGNEYEALRLFCKHYDLEQPNFPLLSPEFTRPLFLLLICDGLKQAGQKKFPSGFNGIGKIFDLYEEAVIQKLISKREEYARRNHILKQAIHELAIACFDEKGRTVFKLSEAVEFFDSKYANCPNLLDDLILEGVLIQNLYDDYSCDRKIEFIYFSYERFGDFLVAKELLEPYQNSEAIKKAFLHEERLGKLIENGSFYHRGTLEAIAIILPEKYQLEIFEVFNWVFHENEENDFSGNKELVSRLFVDSLRWRESSSMDLDKLNNWIKSDLFYLNEDSWLFSLIELTSYNNHPFNSDRFHRGMMGMNMPERDSFWQLHLHYFSSSDDYGNAHPIRRLIDWAWQDHISDKTDDETARLTAQTLAWVLSSTKRSLRDQTTKALVNLLQEQPKTLLKVLNAFEGIDDLYILERLYAVAYGCALRTTKAESLKQIAQYVLTSVFSKNPPEHVLLRDYAKNTVEYAVHQGIELIGDINRIQPPYGSNMPESIPDEDELKTYKLDYNTPDFEKGNGRMQNKISFSVLEWDFGKYTISSALRGFQRSSFKVDLAYIDFLKNLRKDARQAIRAYKQLIELKSMYSQNKENLVRRLTLDKYNEWIQSFEEGTETVDGELKRLLDENEYHFFKTKLISHFLSKQKSHNYLHDSLDSTPIKRWIVKRVFDLGYDLELHGEYDRMAERRAETDGASIERIGKKYQWIAFHEIMAKVADNYKFKEPYGEKTKYQYYKGPWQNYLRDIDPAFITRKNSNDEDRNIELSNNWWMDWKYSHWHIPVSEWIVSHKDLPDPRQIIERKDEVGEEWIYLKANINWEEPKPIGKDKYEADRKEIWYLIQAYLVSTEEEEVTLTWLKEQSFWGRWLPENPHPNTGLCNRENYWSDVSKESNQGEWQELDDSGYQVIVTTSDAVGEMSDDKSGTHFIYDMPCEMIFKEMGLQYSQRDGEFHDANGELVVLNPNRNQVLIKKQPFLNYLKSKNLKIIWTLLGEKNFISERKGRDKSEFKVINGIYNYSGKRLKGSLRLAKRD